MKRNGIPMILALLALAALGGCAGMYATPPADTYRPAGDLDVSYFYDALSPYGDWLWTDAYGWVWRPLDVAVDWRPYTDGQWVWTDDGWTWASDLDWGWAPFHYGRWFDDDSEGWCWVPGREWAPAWVAWREGGGWVGWAPLPPEVRWRGSTGFDRGDWNDLPGVRHHWWSFCRERDLPGPDLQRRLAPRPRAVSLLKDTRDVTRYASVETRVVNRSLDLDRIRQAYGHDIRAYHVTELSSPPDRRGRQLTRDAFYAYRPRLGEAPEGRTPRVVRVPRPAAPPAVAPAPTPSLPATVKAERDARDRQRREELALERRQAAERRRLQQEQDRESSRPPAGSSPEQLRRQHEAEQQAFAEQTARDRRVLEARQQEELRLRSERRAPGVNEPPPGKAEQTARERDARRKRGE